MTDLQRSHAEVRAAVILAGKEIRKLNFGRSDSPVLATLRPVLREPRVVARSEGITTRVRLECRREIHGDAPNVSNASNSPQVYQFFGARSAGPVASQRTTRVLQTEPRFTLTRHAKWNVAN
jgi:hypothetical protein